MPVSEVARRVVDVGTSEHGVEGITLLGGEPLAHAGPAAALARRPATAA